MPHPDYYKNARKFMKKRGLKRGLDFDNPQKHASTDEEWRYMTTEMLLIARAGDGREQYVARLRPYIELYAHECEDIQNKGERAKVASFQQHLVQLAGTNQQKRRFRRESR